MARNKKSSYQKQSAQQQGTQARQTAQASAREAMRLQAQAQAKTTQRNRLIAVIAGVVVFALVVLMVAYFTTRTPASTSSTSPSTSTAPGQTQTSYSPVTTVAAGQIVPPHADANLGWYEFKTDNVAAGAPVVDVHFDFQCPWCKIAENNFSGWMEELYERGDIIYRVHVRTLVGEKILYNDSSNRASQAAACADTVGAFLKYSDVVFSNQPQEGVGYTDQQLESDYPAQAGITGDNLTAFQQCYSSDSTKDFASAMEYNNWNNLSINDGVAVTDPRDLQGTPSYWANGHEVQLGTIMQTSSPYAPTISNADELLAALKSAAGA